MNLLPMSSTCDEMKNVETLKMKLKLTALHESDMPAVVFSHVKFYAVSIFTILKDEKQIGDLGKWSASAKSIDTVKKNWDKG